MKRFAYRLTLLDDLVISRHAATLGGHQSLDYVPGQTLLGACAAHLYEQLNRADAYRLFHSGQLRFGNALPLSTTGPAWPLPLCWHQRKTQPARRPDHTLDAEKLFNFQRLRGFEDGAQPTQLRDGYVDAHGRLHKPARQLRMKTAIDPDSGRAAEAQLFGYQAVARGTRLGGWIEADDGLPDELVQQVWQQLQGQLSLGRSRSAEYGRVHLEAARFDPPVAGAIGNERRITLWLLADLALQDAWGQPTLDPRPEHLGLPAGRVDWQHSFLRNRRYTPWNGKRGAPDLERPVLEQGGVITLDLDAPPGPDLAALLAEGVGLYREAGLGRVWLNPPLLAGDHPRFEKASTKAVTADAPDCKHPLIAWLRSEVDADDEQEKLEALARRLSRSFEVQRSQAAGWRGLPADASFGPSRSQWGRVLECARRTSSERLPAALFEGNEAIIKPSAEGWGEHCPAVDGRNITLSDWLREQLLAQAMQTLPRLVQRLAHLCRDALEHATPGVSS